MTDERPRPRPVSDRSSRPEPVRPRNVREGMPGEGAPPEIETEERVLELDGVEWTVRSEGRARVRSGGDGTPLIQLVFRSGEDDSELEGLAVGSKLSDLSEAALSEALRTSRPHRPDREPPPFFEGTRQTGGRGRG